MKPSDVKARVKAIEAEMDDPESAHSDEDQLYIDVLSAVADGSAEDPAGCAREALRSRKLDFPRWCA